MLQGDICSSRHRMYTAYSLLYVLSHMLWQCRNNMLFVETSAKTAANTAELFESVARQISRPQHDAPPPASAPAESNELPTSQATS